ncbi:MAG TPA: uroporphyrinogen-III synthase, partial [Chloroflexota bacterium]|nr:uroporphyrinogen-III synthase [Chloroflexota bacterium]
RQDTAGLLDVMRGMQQRGRILLPQSDLAPEALANGLEDLGFDITRVVAYRTCGRAGGVRRARELIRNGDATVVVITSPSALRAVVEGDPAVSEGLARLALVAIGPQTAAAIEKTGYPRPFVARTPAADDLARAIAEAVS